MAATEMMVGSSAILSIKPLHPSYEFGRSYKKQIPSLQASMAGKEDHGATLRKPHEESSSRSSSSVSSLLKAVQESGSSAVLQQVSSMRHFFMPELPHAIITEIKKRMALSFKDEDDEQSAIQDDLNGGLLEKAGLEEQVQTLMGPRCAWPRLKLVSAEEERQEEAMQGPRCAWPRGAQIQGSSSSVQQETRPSSTEGGGANGAKCSWPRAISRSYYQSNTERLQNGSNLEGFQNGSPQEGLVTSMSSSEALEKESQVNHSVNNEGPRCSWPRSTPRRMLATGVGLSLINYLFIAQGAPALAILLETPLSIICEEESSLSSPHKSLLP